MPQERRREPLELVDPRKPVNELKRQLSPEELRAPLPVAVRKGRDAAQNQVQLLKDAKLLRELAWKVIGQLCGVSDLLQKEKDPPEPLQDAPRKWYRIHPQTDTTYFVRPDPGMRGRVPGYCCPEEEVEEEEEALSPLAASAPPPQLFQRMISWRREASAEVNDLRTPSRSKSQSKLLPVAASEARKRRKSLPAQVERRVGLKLESLTGFNDDLCLACASAKREVILLPCRHSVLCEACTRRASFYCWRKGYRCPMCRRRVREVVRMYDEAVFPQYGYAIKALA